jgi:cytochrome c-type biogenesis protein
VITILIDSGEADDVRPFLTENGYTMPVLIDPKAEVFTRFGLIGTPGTFIVDRRGNIVAKGLGPVEFDHPDFRNYVLSVGAQV